MMKNKKLHGYLKAALLLLLFGISSTYGATWYVSQEGNDENDGTSWSSALANPQSAIDRASAGDSVLIGDGTYYATRIVETASDTIYSTSFVLKEGVSLHGGYIAGQNQRSKGEYAWSFGGKTILTIADGNSGTVLVNETPFTTETHVDGLVLEGGTALGAGEDGFGGGARLSGAVSLHSCIIQGNIAGNGGGVYLGEGAKLKHCLVRENCVLDEGWGGNGGGIYATSNTQISNCLVTGNGSGVRKGGGIYTTDNARIDFCTIVANEAIREGSGLYMAGNAGTVSSTVVWGNSGSTLQASIAGNASHCAIEGNSPNESCIPLQKGNSGIHGNAYNDNWVGGYFPCFASPENGDWRLGAGSYLINRGSNANEDSDAAGNARSLCGAADIGAFETPYRGNLALDFELELPCIYGNTSSVLAVPGALTPAEISITFQDASFAGDWQNNGADWSVLWKSAGTAFPTMQAIPANTSHWNALSLQRELQVSRRPIYISADDKEYTYLEEMPQLTWHIIAGSLAEGDTINGTLQCESNATLETAWPITKGTLSIDDGANGTNYLLKFYNGEMLCHKAEPELTFTAKSGTYNGGALALEIETEPAGLDYTCEYRDETGALLSGAPSNAGTYTATITIQDPHYSGTYTSDFTIEKATLTAHAMDASRQYQSPNGDFTVNVTGFLGTDGPIDIEMPIATSAAGYEASAGEYPISVSGGSARNYNFQYVNGTLTVTKADVNAEVEDSALVFGDAVEEAPITGHASHSGNGTTVPGTFSWVDDGRLLNAGDNEVAWIFIPDNTQNYKSSSGTAIIHVAQQALQIKADDITIAYGDEESALTYTVTPSNSDLVASGTLVREQGNNAGTYKIKLGTLDFGPNYLIDFTEGNYTILPREIMVKINNIQKEYGEADPELQYEILGGSLIGDSFFTGTPQREAGENIGYYEINQGSLAISDAQNYTATIIPGTFSIVRSTKPGLLETLQFGDIKYGDMLGDIEITGTMLTADGTKEMQGYFQWKEPDTYPSAGRQSLEWIFTPYDLTTSSPFSGAVEIEVEKAVLDVQITGGASSRYYKEPNPQYELVYSGFIGDDDETCIKVPPQIDTIANYEAMPGTYLVNIKGGEADHYTFQATPVRLNVLGRKVVASTLSEIEATPIGYGERLEHSEVNGYIIDENTGDIITGTFLWKASDSMPLPGLSIQQCIFIPASSCYTGSVVSVPIMIEKGRIRISSLPASKNYGEMDPELQWVCLDIKNDLLPENGFVMTIGRQDGEDAGEYETFLAYSEENDLFEIDFVPGVFTIKPLPLHVTANDTFKYYMADDPVFNCTVTDEMPDGVQIYGTPCREEGEEIGTYKIGMGSLTLSSPNYYIDLVKGTFTIYKRPLYVNLVNNWKYYDKQTETLEYTVINTLKNSDVTLVGTLSRKAGEDVGNYLVDTSALQPTDPEHFCVASNNVTFQIRPRKVTVQFDDQEGTYMEPNPVFTYRVVEGTVLEGDTFSGSGTSPALLGTNNISQGSLTLGSNYSLTCIPGTFTVYTDIPYIVFEGFDRELYAYDSLQGIGIRAKAYREHFNTEVEGTFSITPSNKVCNAGTETVTLKFAYKRRQHSSSTAYTNASVTQTIAFNVNKVRITIKTGDYAMTYGDQWPAFKYELVSCSSDQITSPLNLLTGNFLSFDTDGNEIGTFPILYSPEDMTNSNVELAVQAGTITISPRILLVGAKPAYAVNSEDFNTEALSLDYDVLKVVNTKTKNPDLDSEKANAPVLKLQCNANRGPGVYKISFLEYTPDNYEDHSECYDFQFADGVFHLFESEEKQAIYEEEQANREISATQNWSNNIFDVAFVTTDTTGKGANYFSTYDSAYRSLKNVGIICYEPGTHDMKGEIASASRPIEILGLADEEGNLPIILGKFMLLSNSYNSAIENLNITGNYEYCINIIYANSNVKIRNCNLTAKYSAIYNEDSAITVEDCTYDAPRLLLR